MKTMRTPIIFSSLIFLAGCAPPVAPAELQQLACFVFDHIDDEEDETLKLALENLSIWFDQPQEEDIEEGYQISLLTQAAVSDLEGENHSLRDELIGAAVAHESGGSVLDIAYTTAVADWATIIGEDQYEFYDRTYIEGGECIGDRECMATAARSHSELSLLGISIESNNRIDYRWIETDMGWAFVHRSWLTEPPNISSTAVDTKSQYYVAITLPRDPVVRVQATWIDTELLGIQVPKNQVVKTMREQGDKVEEWMSINL
ncbi:MAG: hypothetical protein ACI8S6_003248 [Myxococcota bacterium]|jgi:hypothetical protein